jgi:hypothetical protein
VQRLRATARGRKLLLEGRARRVARLARELRALPARDLAALEQAADVQERLLGTKRGPG